jgi:hypothetical protein
MQLCRLLMIDASNLSAYDSGTGDQAMKHLTACRIIFAACALGICGQAGGGEESRPLKVHLAQANNNSPYAFVRAKFNPGEVVDPWAVRFFDEKGKEVPYFVWDSITWRVAREGRADWGRRYALLNHGPGDGPRVIEARGKKLEWTRKKLPQIGAQLEALEQAAAKSPDSVCAALYLLRYSVPALGKERLTVRIYPEKQVKPKLRKVANRERAEKITERLAVKQGALEFRGLPDRLAIFQNGKEIFRCAGFQAGGTADTVSHADPLRPFVVEMVDGIITKISVSAQTKGRQDGVMDWQCCYWLFPEGSFVALEGFSIGETAGYVGGPQKLSIWQTDGKFSQRRTPLWETPWWLHQSGERGFLAIHLFHATPLTIGFGNNPFAVNAEGPKKDPQVQVDGRQLALTWSHRIDDPAIARVMSPQPLRRPKDPPLKEQPKPAPWQPNIDWLYRQYACGLGEKETTAEDSLRMVLGAAAGWIDRPVSEEDVASLLVKMMPRIATRGESSELGLLKIVPAVLQDDAAAINEALRRARDPVERTNFYINLIRGHVARGGKPAEGKKKDDPDDTPREGWTGNPCYHAALMPCYVRVLDHFDLLSASRRKAYRDAILRYADFTLEVLGGDPLDFDKLDAVFRSEWPSRIVPVVPVMLHANTLHADQRYTRAAKILFQEIMRLVERNPHGYFPVWTWKPKAERYDTVYNPVSYERGITALWSDEQVDVIGRKEAAQFVAAQARWLVFSGQLLDSFELDNPTAIRAFAHGGHTMLRNQIGIYLYDDFTFYRGLLAGLVTWSAAACQVPGSTHDYGLGPYRSLELSNAGSSMLRWALAIRPGSTWQESKVRKLSRGAFKLQAWNRKPLAQPTFKVTAQDAGLKTDAEVLQVQLNGPAFRVPADFEVTPRPDMVSLKVSQPAKIRLAYTVLQPGWGAKDKLVLERRGPGNRTEVVRSLAWQEGFVEWQATPGEYELRTLSK